MDELDQKQCNRCGAIRERSEFYREPGNKDGLEHSCKRCRAEQQRQRRNDGGRNEPRKERPATGVVKCCTTCNIEQDTSEFYERSDGGLYNKCRTCQIEYARQWQENNHQHFLDYQRRYEKERRKQVNYPRP